MGRSTARARCPSRLAPAAQGAYVLPDRGFQPLAVEVGARTGDLAGGHHAVLAGAAVVVARNAARQGPGHAMHRQTTGAASEQAAQQMIVLLVVPERQLGIARQLRLRAVP